MANRFRNHHHRIAFTRLCIAAAMCACAVSGAAQDTGAPNGQEEPLKFSEQQAGAPAVHTSRLTRAFSWTMAQLDGQPGVRDGWYPEMGGLIPGAGFSVGAGTGTVCSAIRRSSTRPQRHRGAPIG